MLFRTESVYTIGNAHREDHGRTGTLNRYRTMQNTNQKIAFAELFVHHIMVIRGTNVIVFRVIGGSMKTNWFSPGKPDLWKKNTTIFNQTRQTFLHLSVSLANTTFRRLKGLLGHRSLLNNEGLRIAPSRGIHTIGLFFSIDVVFLDESCRVVHLIENLKPFRITPIVRNSDSVLQLPVRSIYSSNTKPGDQLLILPLEQMQSYCSQPWVSRNREKGISQPVDLSKPRRRDEKIDSGERFAVPALKRFQK